MAQSELKAKSPVAAVSFDLPSENIDLLNWNLIGLGGVDSSTPISNMRKKDPGKPSDSDPEANLSGLSPSPCQFFGLSSSPSCFSPSFAENRAWPGIAVPDPRAPTTERGKVAPDLRARACSGIGAPDLRAPTTERGKVAPDPRARAPDRRSPSMGSPDLGMKSPRSSPDDDDNLMDLSMEAPGSRRSRGCREGRYTVMVPQTELKPNQTLHQVNPRSVKWLLNEVYPAYKRTSIDRSLNLVDFLSPEVTKQLITRAKRKWRGLLWHMPDESIPNQLSDQNVKEVLCHLIRPSGAVQYRELLLKHVERIPKSLEWTFGVLDYDIKISDLVVKVLADFKLFDDYFRHEAEPELLVSYPAEEYGKEKQPGIFWLALECFQQYKENFRTLLTPKFLSKCKDKEEFIGKFLELNDQWTDRAEKHRMQNEQGMPSEKPEFIMERVNREKTQKGYLEGLSRKPSYDRSKANLNMYQQQHGSPFFPPIEDAEEQDPEVEAAVVTGDGETRVLSELPDDYEEAEFKAVVESFNRAENRGGSAFKPKPPFSPAGRGSARPPLRKFSAGRGSSPGGAQQRTLVCYYYAIHGECEKGKDCPFSHDSGLAREWLQSKMKVYSGSPLLSSGQAANRSDPSLQQRVFPPKRPDALYRMGASQSSLSTQPSMGGAGGEDEEDS